MREFDGDSQVFEGERVRRDVVLDELFRQPWDSDLIENHRSRTHLREGGEEGREGERGMGREREEAGKMIKERKEHL